MESGEVCDICGRRYLTVFQIPDELWLKLMGDPGGNLCLNCCDGLLRRFGISLYWEAAIDRFPTD